VFEDKRNLKRKMAVMAGLVVAWIPVGVQAQADATGAGFHRGDWKWVIKAGNAGKDPQPTGFLSLMQNVRMASSGPPLDTAIVNFGPYANETDYPLTLTLTAVGGHRNKFASIYVGGVMVAGVSDGSVLTYTIPAKATYSWQLKNDRTISVSVAAISLTPDEIRKIGLPSAQQFNAPRPSGQYKGCVEYWKSGWFVESGDSGGSAWGQSPQGTFYYYAEGPWSDGSFETHRNLRQWVDGLENWGIVIEGPEVQGTSCVVVGKVDAPPPPAQPLTSGRKKTIG
jgi:hypothetical protein